MRTIERTAIFKRDFKREMRGRHRSLLEVDLRQIIEALANDRPLEPRYHDHALIGNWKDYRDCHIRPNLVLLYRLIGQHRLILVRLGSHSQLDL
ncbi:type II toxin-antitoxin system YafQ family toxin [Bartonella sp. B23]